MVLVAVKQIEQNVSLNDVENVTILGLDQCSILLFTATYTNSARSSSTPRTVIGGVQLDNGEQKIYYRHPTCVKITHASINAARTLCCFVIRTESYNFNAFLAEIGSPNTGRLFSLKFSRSSPIRSHLGPYDSILFLYRDGITIFRMPNTDNLSENSVDVDRDAHLNNCIYYQWDTIQQRLHVIQKRSNVLSKILPTNGFEALVYIAYTINARGQFDKIMSIDFDFKTPSTAYSHSDFEILSNDTSLYFCWQSKMIENMPKIDYAIISLGHGRSLYLSKPLNADNWKIFQSRKVHFGLLDGDYVFAILRGEFIHLLNFNIELNFFNHLLLSNDEISLPYDTKYTTQRGLPIETPTLIYEKRNLFTYTIELSSNEIIKTISPATIEPIIGYALVAAKDNTILLEILQRILFQMYDDLYTKAYLKEILTGLIFVRLSKRIHHNKYVLVFPATTIDHRHPNTTDVRFDAFAHRREHAPEYYGSKNIEKEYFDRLRSSFDICRKYRRKVSYYHPIMTSSDDNDLNNSIGSDFTLSRRGSTLISPPPLISPTEQRPSSPSIVSIDQRRPTVSQKYFVLLEPENNYLFENVSNELRQLHSSWDQGRIHELAFEYVQATQDQCDYLIRSFTRLANFDRKTPLIDKDPEPSSEKYKTLLVVLEKLYLAMIELGFSPTNEFEQTLLDLSFRVMPFDRFVAAIDQNILTLTEEFVSRVINELDDNSKSYAIKEQLIFMLPNNNTDLHTRLFTLMYNDRAKQTAAQLLVARKYSTNLRNRETISTSPSLKSQETTFSIDEIMNINSNQNDTNNQSKLIEQAAMSFFRDCDQKGILDEEEMSLVKIGLLSMASYSSMKN